VGQPFLSIIVPCYNERENLQRGVLEEMQSYLQQQTYSYEVLVSDDGSSDDSLEVVRQHLADKPAFRLLENAHGGKPWAVWRGIQAASGEIVLFTDMDQSTPLNQLDKVLPMLQGGYDVVIGSRGMERDNFPLYRQVGSSIFRLFRKVLLLRSIKDTQCGFKALRAPVAREVFPKLEAIQRPARVTGWKVTAFDVELLYLAERAGYRLGEVTVAWANRDTARGKGKSYLSESREMALQILRVKVNEWRGVYGPVRQAR
jgi:dolichyl-phosphate beta-glucosyltransferase